MPRAGTVPPPDMAQPAEPKNYTMRIATPLGYSSRPPRKMWPYVLVVAMLLGLGGGAFAVAWFGSENSVGSGSGSGSGTGSATVTVTVTAAVTAAGSATGSATGSAAGSAATVTVTATATGSATVTATGSATGPTTASVAVIVIDSTPQGADVIGPDKQLIGKTPARLSLPISDLPQVFEIRLAGFKKKTKEIIVTGNAVVSVELDRAPPIRKRSGNELMNPDDL